MTLENQTCSRREWLQLTGATAATLCWNSLAAGDTKNIIVEEGPYVRPFGPLAPWNIPAKDLPRHEQSEKMVEQLWRDPAGPRPNRVHITVDSHTFAVYNAQTRTVPTRVVSRESNTNGFIPWNPGWKPALGEDAHLIVLDPPHGSEWDLTHVQSKLNGVHCNSVNRVPGDFRTRELGFTGSRASGIPFLAMLVRPQEIAAGKIEHALSMSISNASVTKFVAPATRAIGAGAGRVAVPLGTRFVLSATDEQIDRWMASLPQELPDETRSTARIVAVALRDYGWFITGNAPGMLIQFESRHTAERAWNSLGLIDQKVGQREYPRDLLEGLLDAQHCLAIVPSDEYPEALRARDVQAPQP